jgi:UDP-glucose 4-epimerase
VGAPLPLVVGGAGFIGSALVRTLAEAGPVRVLDDLSTGKAENLAGVSAADLRVGSILDPAAVRAALEGVDTVFHLACLGVRHSLHDPVGNHAVNAGGTLLLLEAARESSSLRRFVYTSTSEVYGTATRVPMDEDHPAWPHTVYGGSKLAGEAYVRAYHRSHGMPTVVLRPFNAYGPRSHHEGDSGEAIPKFLVRAMNGLPPIVFGDGMQTRDFTFVEDTARGIAAAGTAPGAVGETLNLGRGRETRILDLALAVVRAAGRPELRPEHAEPRPGDILRLLADARKAERLLGWTPRTDLEEGLRSLVAWHGTRGTDWKAALREDVPRNWEAPAR